MELGEDGSKFKKRRNEVGTCKRWNLEEMEQVQSGISKWKPEVGGGESWRRKKEGEEKKSESSYLYSCKGVRMFPY
ncbi:hypothetical protein N7504_000909 [Penicillium tannophilum]|nr:hypothetical protein N7504_000909 [Penicillium tannophilum]